MTSLPDSIYPQITNLMTLTEQQVNELKHSYCEQIINNMDMDDLMLMCYDLIRDSYQDATQEEIVDEIKDLYDENTLEQIYKDANIEYLWFYPFVIISA